MKKLDVFFGGWGQRWLLGTLADDGRQLLFEYSAEALKQGLELSALKLPLRAQAYGGFPPYLSRLPGLVADSLPDGWGLLLMDRLFLQSGRPLAGISPLDRLSFIGERGMGALSFVPASQASLSADDLSLLQMAQAVREVVADRDTAALQQLAMVGGSPHGARPKVLVQVDAQHQHISTLDGAPGTPWLIKFPAGQEHKEVCAIEQAYCGMARRCGLEVPTTRLFEINRNLAAFGIERFDRERGMRVPVQSFAAALHADFRVPSLDYQSILRATLYFTADVRQVEAAFRRCVFNVVFNNRDDHAKNFALRMNEQMQWQLAPAYDLTFNSGPGGYHQTSVMGEALEPGRRQLLALAADASLKKRVAEDILDTTLEVASSIANELQAYPSIRKGTVAMITSAVGANMNRCA
ncbi:type II toxin-antitoxin system HipA family toxin [Ideonella sp.]|jgi:serine/threonine-protein kinase HipA|uniref:type II toxin-antitoxin system HipA family toxin n=1 Tax=Ideonella sp. TaxID=1929293 RepID=UPI0037C0CB95